MAIVNNLLPQIVFDKMLHFVALFCGIVLLDVLVKGGVCTEKRCHQ